MRVMTVAIIGIVAACVAFPASAQRATAPPTWEDCHDQLLKHGWHDGQKGSAEFLKECQAGKIPGVSRASARLVTGTFEECEARALALGMPHGQTGHVEYVGECMGRRPSSPASQRR